MIFGVFSPAGCSSKDKTAPGGDKTPVSDPDLACPMGAVRLAGASKKTTDTCMLDTDGDGIPDPPDLACPMGAVRLAGASKKTTDTCMLDTDGDGIFNSIDIDDDGDGYLDSNDEDPSLSDVDDDGDGLIEIDSLVMLHNIRYNLIGDSYKTSDDAASDAGDKTGCGGTNGVAVCNGYELTQDLNFDTNGDGTWSGDSASGYTLDSEDNASPYFVVDGVDDDGWEPIGEATITSNSSAINCNNLCFNAIFEGNGHTITGLAIRREELFIGMFGFIDTNAEIRNIGLINNLSDCTRMSDNNYIGGLVGLQNAGSIIANYTTGAVDGGAGRDNVGGLVGYQNAGSIIANYTTGTVNGGAGRDDVGGLVGYQNAGSIIANYTTGAVDGGDAGDYVGGLVGLSSSLGSITSNIIASYATGAVNGGDGNDDVGYLVGFSGRTVGITASYGFGAVGGIASSVEIGGVSISSAMALTSMTSISIIDPTDSTMMMMITTTIGALWNDATKNTKDAWDFGTTNQTPALKYADYDGTSDKYYCTNAMRPTTGMPIPIPNCGTLIPGQR